MNNNSGDKIGLGCLSVLTDPDVGGCASIILKLTYILQIAAIVGGVRIAWDLNFVLCVILGIVIGIIPVVGCLIAIICVVKYAGWSLMLAIAILAGPQIVFRLIGMYMGHAVVRSIKSNSEDCEETV